MPLRWRSIVASSTRTVDCLITSLSNSLRSVCSASSCRHRSMGPVCHLLSSWMWSRQLRLLTAPSVGSWAMGAAWPAEADTSRRRAQGRSLTIPWRSLFPRRVPSDARVRVPGGYSVTGRWPFGSGSPHGTWFAPVCAVEEGEHATGEVIFVYAPRKDVLLHDNWQVSGLCATGSVDFEFVDVFVPDRLVHAFQPEPTQPGTLYRLPTRSIFPWTVATVPLGIAAGAIDDFTTKGRSAKRHGDSVPFAERELIQSQLGQIQARTAASRAYLRHTMTTLLEGIEAGTDLEASRVDFRLACTFASQSALWAINLVTEMAGAVAILRSSPLERRERDARAAVKHVAMSPAAYITGGKLRLGCDLSNASF